MYSLRLAHIRVKVVEITQLLRPETRIRVCRVVPLVMFNVNEDIVLLCGRKQLLVVFEQLHGWLCDEDVNATLNCVQSDWVVSGVRREDSN